MTLPANTTLAVTQLLAHQGGWDEILMVLVPVGIFAALLYVANQRAARLATRDSGPVQFDETSDPSGRTEPDDQTEPARTRSRTPSPRNERRGPI